VPPRLGLSGVAELAVTDDCTAIAQRSGDVPVLATPKVVAVAEEAAIRALDGVLDDNQTTVGMRIQLDHLAPTPIGRTVLAEATLKRIEGRRLTFNVSVSDERGLVAAGTITRVVVDRDRFLERADGFR
jgi:fluoroacetyl-CoA thioesterase